MFQVAGVSQNRIRISSHSPQKNFPPNLPRDSPNFARRWY
jgi:hypothetical protein